jgi:hypothetical protein
MHLHDVFNESLHILFPLRSLIIFIHWLTFLQMSVFCCKYLFGLARARGVMIILRSAIRYQLIPSLPLPPPTTLSPSAGEASAASADSESPSQLFSDTPSTQTSQISTPSSHAFTSVRVSPSPDPMPTVFSVSSQPSRSAWNLEHATTSTTAQPC